MKNARSTHALHFTGLYGILSGAKAYCICGATLISLVAWSGGEPARLEARDARFPFACIKVVLDQNDSNVLLGCAHPKNIEDSLKRFFVLQNTQHALLVERRYRCVAGYPGFGQGSLCTLHGPYISTQRWQNYG